MSRSFSSLLLASLFVACAAKRDASGENPELTDGAAEVATDTGTGFDPDVNTDVADGSDTCDPPDVLIILDRTLTMAYTPKGDRPANTPAGHAETKWFLAMEAINGVTAPPTDATVRFGLELFPRDPGGTSCLTLTDAIHGLRPANPECETGEVVVEPALNAGSTITSILDPETTTICMSTPIAGALDAAAVELAKVKKPSRKQFVVFVSDGENTCSENPIASVNKLQSNGVNTYVVGFDGATSSGVSAETLNDMACAGRTARDFSANCVPLGSSYRAVTDPAAPLYFTATNEDELVKQLKSVFGNVCCNCIL